MLIRELRTSIIKKFTAHSKLLTDNIECMIIVKFLKTIQGKITLYFSIIVLLSMFILIQIRVVTTNDEIKQKRIELELIKKKQLKDYIEMIYGIIQYGYETGKSKVQVKNEIRVISYENTGYFFVYRLDGTAEVMPPKPEVEGVFRKNIQDKKGNFIIKDMLTRCNLYGEGYTKYYFDKPGSDKIVPKITYVKQFTPWQWFVGTGVYIDDIDQKVSDYKKSMQKRLYWDIFLYTIIFLALFFNTMLIIRKNVSKPITLFKNYILRLGKGELPEEFKISTNNEIQEMANAINILNKNLKNTREFAIEVGKGHFDTEVNVFNNKGDLGGALVEMRKSLYKVSLEREQQKKEEQQRTWTSYGMAKFSEILRLNNDNLDTLTFQIISNLVRYLNAAQGGLFLLQNENPKDVYIKLVNCFAFGRKRIYHKRVEIGEGLVGRCLQEEETIYMTDIPPEYLNIKSGTGDHPPRSVLIVPMKFNKKIVGFIELASFNELEPFQINFVEKVSETIASAIRTVQSNKKTQELLNELEKRNEQKTPK